MTGLGFCPFIVPQHCSTPRLTVMPLYGAQRLNLLRFFFLSVIKMTLTEQGHTGFPTGTFGNDGTDVKTLDSAQEICGMTGLGFCPFIVPQHCSTPRLPKKSFGIADSIKANLHKFGRGNQRFPTSHITKIAETAILFPGHQPQCICRGQTAGTPSSRSVLVGW